METVMRQEPWVLEPWLLAIPWNAEQPFGPSRKLRVAVMWDDGVVQPHPPIRRALEETVSRLGQDSNVEVSEWTPWKHEYAWDLTVRNQYHQKIAGEIR